VSRPWGRAVAPVAEWVARAFWSTSTKPARLPDLPIRLTQPQRHIAKGDPYNIPTNTVPAPQGICSSFGVQIPAGSRFCKACAIDVATEHIKAVGKAD